MSAQPARRGAPSRRTAPPRRITPAHGAAAAYFAAFKDLLSPVRGAGFAAAFAGRRQRPPTDPVNAALSFAYADLGLLPRAAATLSALGRDLPQSNDGPWIA